MHLSVALSWETERVPQPPQRLTAAKIPEIVDPCGPSPVLIYLPLLRRLTPEWLSLSFQLKRNPEADRIFGCAVGPRPQAFALSLRPTGCDCHVPPHRD